MTWQWLGESVGSSLGILDDIATTAQGQLICRAVDEVPRWLIPWTINLFPVGDPFGVMEGNFDGGHH